MANFRLVATIGRGRQADGEDERRRPGVALVLSHVVDAEARLVVDDRAHPLAVGDDGSPSRLAEIDRKVSFGSPARSPLTGTAIVLVAWPAANVTVPDLDW